MTISRTTGTTRVSCWEGESVSGYDPLQRRTSILAATVLSVNSFSVQPI